MSEALIKKAATMNTESTELIEQAKKDCKCCPDCNDWPCEGSLNWDGRCDMNQCDCPGDTSKAEKNPSKVKFIVTIPCVTREQGKDAAEEVWGGSMMWVDGVAWPIAEHPCTIKRIDERNNTPDGELIERYRKTVGRIFKEIGPDLDDVDVLHDVLKFLRGESQ
jgi:hypothetical protein